MSQVELSSGVNSFGSERLLDLLSNKENITIEINGFCDENGRLSLRLISRVNLKQNVTHKIALVSLETGSFIPNVDSTNNKFFYSPDGGTTRKKIELPVCAVNISTGDSKDLTYESLIKGKIKDLGDNPDNVNIKLNPATGHTHVELKGGYKVYFHNVINTWRECLGFNARNLETNGIHISDNIANVLQVQKVYVGCNLCTGSICPVNVPSRNILFSFPNSKAFGAPVVCSPNPLRPRLLQTKTFDTLDLYFFSDDGKPITFLGRQVTGEISIWQV